MNSLRWWMLRIAFFAGSLPLTATSAQAIDFKVRCQSKTLSMESVFFAGGDALIFYWMDDLKIRDRSGAVIAVVPKEDLGEIPSGQYVFNGRGADATLANAPVLKITGPFLSSTVQARLNLDVKRLDGKRLRRSGSPMVCKIGNG